MSDDVTTAATIASLRAEVERLKAELDTSKREHGWVSDLVAVMTRDNNDTFDGINAALDSAGITFLDYDTYAACIGRLAAERDERNAYAERLIAENVQMSNRQTMDREEIESMGRRNDELTKALWTSAEYVKRLESDVARLANDKRGLLDEMDELADEDDRADSLINSIITACTGSGCLNSHELRKALDTARNELEQYRMRLAGALIASEGGDGQPSDALEYLQNCPTITSVTKVRHALDRERERCGVLERECRKWRDEWTKRYNQNADVWMLAVAEMAETDRTNALNAAKFVAKSGGGQ